MSKSESKFKIMKLSSRDIELLATAAEIRMQQLQFLSCSGNRSVDTELPWLSEAYAHIALGTFNKHGATAMQDALWRLVMLLENECVDNACGSLQVLDEVIELHERLSQLF